MNPDMAEDIGKQIGQALDKALGERIEDRTEGAKEMLDDDDVFAFALVALRDPEDSAVQSGSARAIDPAVVRESDRDAEEVIDIIHSQLCDVFDEEVRDK